MVHAANAIPLHPTGRKLRPSMRTAVIHEVRSAALAAIESKILAHDANRFGVSCFKILCAIDRMPEPTHVFSGESPRPSAEHLLVGKPAVSSGSFAPVRSHIAPPSQLGAILPRS